MGSTGLVALATVVVVVLLCVGAAVVITGRMREETWPVQELEQDRRDLAGLSLRQAVDAPELSVADRLTQVDELRAAGLISEAEHVEARRRILAPD